jgi:predicted acyl esterase
VTIVNHRPSTTLPPLLTPIIMKHARFLLALMVLTWGTWQTAVAAPPAQPDIVSFFADGTQAVGPPASPTSPPPEPAATRAGTLPTVAAAPVVRGSVEQIHIAHAQPAAKVTVEGPQGFRATGATDAMGGLVLRGVPPGDGYRVNVEGREAEPDTVRVLHPKEHPDAHFYASQKLEPKQGYVTTRDGTLLSYRVVLPDPDVHGTGPFDLVITYSGYQPGLKTGDSYQNKPFEKFSALGYAVAGVNMRGSGCSGGAFDFMEPLTWLDGYDVVETFSAQEWVDDVALGDQSWPGLTQLFVASTQPPSLDAIVAGSVVGDFYRDVFFPGGIPNVGFGRIWATGRDVENAWPTRRKEVNAQVKIDPACAANQALRCQNVSLLETLKSHPYDDEHWQSRSAEALVAKIKVPTLQLVSWQDPQVGSRPAILSERFPADTPVRLIGVNGFHQYWSGAVWDEIVEFLDVYLGDTSNDEIAQYESENDFMVLLESDTDGDVRGRFTLPAYAEAGQGQRLILGSDLKASNVDTGTSSAFTYNPSAPGTWATPVQGQVTFTSEALRRQSVMAGSGSVDLWIIAEAEDVDLQATLSEVRPDKQEMLVQSGWLRASHRALDELASTALRPRHQHTAKSIEKLVPGQWVRLRIELFPFAHVFREGSRIRLIVSGPGAGSNAWPWAFETLPGGFEVRISHDSQHHISSIVLPTVQPKDLSLRPSLPECGRVWLQPCRPID